MKAPKLVLACAAMLISIASFSQTDSTKKDTTRRDSTRKDSLVQVQQAETSTTVEQSAATVLQSEQTPAQKKFPAPNAGRNYIAVLGNFQSSQTDVENKSITITADENNAGKIWIEGLTPVKFYALLKAVPGTYKIPAQKQEDKSIAEGTVQYDDQTKQINVCVGCGYESNPTTESASATEENSVKTAKASKAAKHAKAKTVISFSGTKTDQGTVSSK